MHLNKFNTLKVIEELMSSTVPCPSQHQHHQGQNQGRERQRHEDHYVASWDTLSSMFQPLQQNSQWFSVLLTDRDKAHWQNSSASGTLARTEKRPRGGTDRQEGTELTSRIDWNWRTSSDSASQTPSTSTWPSLLKVRSASIYCTHPQAQDMYDILYCTVLCMYDVLYI